MAENLNYNDGGVCHGNNPSNCATYGRLYDWQTAMALPNCNETNCSGQVVSMHRGICPEGWHIPTNEEWNILIDFVGASTAGTKLKNKTGWGASSEHPVIPGTDDYGFSALPGGGYTPGYSLGQTGAIGLWWSATGNIGAAVTYMMLGGSADVSQIEAGKHTHHSVRCILGEKKHFTVTFNTNGGTPATMPYLAVDSGLTLWTKYPADPTKTGSTFGGWFDGEELYTASTTITKDVTLVAKWNKLSDSEDGGTLTDSRDGQNYPTRIIDGKRWMAKNLNYATDDSWCYGEDNSNCAEYGRLYSWDAAKNACPAGWRLSTGDDWVDLVQFAGGYNFAGGVLKSTSAAGRDDLGFSAMLGGYFFKNVDKFINIGEVGIWWRDFMGPDGGPCALEMNQQERVSSICLFPDEVGNGYSVRCVEGE
jgi:uncharacterized protein (TIGR02145 family)/uncharacterized repeat protein (TIGR02543 family)